LWESIGRAVVAAELRVLDIGIPGELEIAGWGDNKSGDAPWEAVKILPVPELSTTSPAN